MKGKENKKQIVKSDHSNDSVKRYFIYKNQIRIVSDRILKH